MAGEKKPRIISINDAAPSVGDQAEVEAEWIRRAVDAAEGELAEQPQAPPWLIRQEQAVRSQIVQEPQEPAQPQAPPIENEMQKMAEEVRAKAREQREMHQREEAIKNPEAQPQPQAAPQQTQLAQPLPAQQTQLPAPQIIGAEPKRPKIVETRDYSMLIAETHQSEAQPPQGQEQEAPKTMKEVVAESALEKFREKKKEQSKLSLKNAYYRVAGIFTDIGKKLRGEKEQ